MKKSIRFLSVLLMVVVLLSSVPFGVSAASGEVIERYEGYIDQNGAYIEFVPEYDGWYGFYSSGAGLDTYGMLCDAEGNEIDFADDNHNTSHFYVKGYLEAGESYYLFIMVDSEKERWINVTVENAIGVVEANVVQKPYDTSVYEGIEVESVHFEGLKMQFKMSDGSYVDWSYDDYKNIYYSPVEWDFFLDEEGNILVEDGSVSIWVGCDGVYDVIELTHEYNPVESIEVSCSKVSLCENVDGEQDYDNNYFHYKYDLPEDTKVTINFKDGTQITAKPGDVVDGYSVNVLDYQKHAHWYPETENYIVVEYMDVTDFVPVTINPDIIMDFEITKLPDKTVYESGYYALWEGAELTVWYKDGSSQSFILSDNALEYNVERGEFIVQVGDYKINIRRDMGRENWYILYLGTGFSATFISNVLDEGIEVNEAKKVADMTVCQVSESGNGTVVEVEYTTGEKETFEFEVADYYYEFDNDDDVYSRVKGWTKTKNGYADYYIEPVYDDNNSISGYNVSFLNYLAFAEADKFISEPEIMGDADENGKVNVKDATAIQKATAGIITLTEEGEKCADVDQNGVVNVKDATAIQKWIAGIETGLPIGETVN